MFLKACDITVRYGANVALDSFSIDIRAGEIICLIGPNGSGKSTALHALAGLAVPDDGTVSLEERPIARWKRRDLAKRLSFLPQNPQSPENTTVEQLVRQGRFAHLGLFQAFSARDRQAVEWAMEQTDLVAFADRDLSELSGGERQRAWIATALAQEADILLLDEPTSFLDIGHQIEVLQLLDRLSKERGMAVVMAIHDLNHAMALADRIVLLSAGRQVFAGNSADLAASAHLQSVFKIHGTFETTGPADEAYFRVPLRSTGP
ncbi:ABC transporter ATP-binding protein [Pararhizobium sp. LjRoot255]|uniref:ABC transporter ATP-binding protein n=1 Tax=Pararhizobium sp. LjRoot255 TaxID=3342298 RepID=UPI003ECEEF1B